MEREPIALQKKEKKLYSDQTRVTEAQKRNHIEQKK
jgi:hypothetical protein